MYIFMLTCYGFMLLNVVNIVLTGLTFPSSDGSANQIIATNGSGVLTFVDPTAINIDGGTAESTYTSTPSIDGGTAA